MNQFKTFQGQSLFSSCIAQLMCALLWILPLSGTAQTFSNTAPGYGVSALPQSINFGSGLSFYDFNQDGLDDLSFTMTNDSLRFYLNTGDGFELLPSFAYGLGESKHILWADYDNDGDQDFILTINNGPYRLYQNDGNLNFTDVSEDAGLPEVIERHYGASFGDYDKDGYLDLYICTYALDEGSDAYNAQNHLYHNNGDGTFTDVTETAGVGDGVRLSFQSVWIDYDMDGWPDLFIINDRLFANSLYRNNGDGTFEDVSLSAGITFPGQDPMTASVVDVDHDGDMDIYLTNTGIPGKLPKVLIDNGDGTFTDEAPEMGITIADWTWGAVWIDYNNDTWHDLYVTTGNPNPILMPNQDVFFENQGDNDFTTANALFDQALSAKSYSTAKGDLNNDGYADIAVLNKDPWDVYIWENSGGENNYIKVTLEGTASNTDAIGSWIKVYAGENTYTHYTLCGENYLAQNSQHHIFGLGALEQVDSISVTYLSGHTDTYLDPQINTHHTYTEGDTYLAEILPEGPTSFCEGSELLLQGGEHASYLWSTGDTTAQITVNTSGTYILTVTNTYGVSASDSLTVNVFPAPDLLESASNVTCPDGEDGAITLQNQTGVEVASCIWENGASGTEIANLPAGIYAYTYTDINGCAVEGTIEITEPEAINIEIFTEPEVEGEDGSILVFASGGTPPFVIIIDGAPLSGNTLDGLTAGTYEILVTDANGCMATGTAEISLINSIVRSDDQEFRLFPNPATDFIRIDSKQFLNITDLYIYNASGLEMHHEVFDRGAELRVPIDLPAGLYLIRLHSDGINTALKFVVR